MTENFDKNKDINELINQYENLIHYILHKHYPSLEFDEDAFQEGRIALWTAIEKYDETKGSFMNWAYSCIYNKLGMIIRQQYTGKRKLNLDSCSLDAPMKEYDNLSKKNTTLYDILIDDSASVDNNMRILELKILLEEFFKQTQLPTRDKDMFIKHIIGFTQREIAKQYDISKSMVNRIVQHTQEKLKSFFNKSMNNIGVPCTNLISML